MDSLDLLFAKVAEVDKNQARLETQFEMSMKVMEQVLIDQQTLAKQMEIIGQAVGRLTLNQTSNRMEEPPSPTDSDTTLENPFHGRRAQGAGGFHQNRAGTSNQRMQRRHHEPGGERDGSR